MSQDVERAKAIIQIRKLREQTTDRGRTESEAMLAMDRMQKLIAVYNIGLDEVFLNSEPCVGVDVCTGKAKDGVMGTIVVGLGKLFNLVVYNKKGSKLVTYHMFGLESDVLAAEFLFETIQKVIDTETAVYRAKHKSYGVRGAKKAAGASFAKGMNSRIYYRLLELAVQTTREVVEATGVTNLIVLKDNRVQDEFRKNGVRLRKTYQQSARASNSSAYYAGSEAGDKVSLNRPLGGGVRSEQLLLA